MFFPVLEGFIDMFRGRKTVAFSEFLEPDKTSILIVGFNYYKNAISYLSIIIVTTADCFLYYCISPHIIEYYGAIIA